MAINWKSDFITFAIFIAILIVIYRIIIMIIKRIDRKSPGSSASTNALKVILRFVTIFIAIIALFVVFDISSSLLVSISSVSGIIIGFGATEVISQMVSGLYLIIARPFAIHDMIKMGNIEGVVVEINLNYTVIKQFDGTFIKIPNKKMIDTQFLNFTLKPNSDNDLYEQLRKNDEKISWKELKNIKLNRDHLQKLVGDLTKSLDQSNITCYTFEIEIEYDKDPRLVKEKLKKVCAQYESIYEHLPRFAVVGFGYRAIFKFWIFCPNPHLIMENQNNFMGSIAETIYGEKEDA
jgi:small-conductance mechanosensitive channel